MARKCLKLSNKKIKITQMKNQKQNVFGFFILLYILLESIKLKKVTIIHYYLIW
jgi:hypothetical protein